MEDVYKLRAKDFIPYWGWKKYTERTALINKVGDTTVANLENQRHSTEIERRNIVLMLCNSIVYPTITGIIADQFREPLHLEDLFR